MKVEEKPEDNKESPNSLGAENWIVSRGNLVVGFEFFGVFNSQKEALLWAKANLQNFEIIPLFDCRNALAKE